MGYRVGVDSGSTFTDLQAIDDDGRVEIVKVPSTLHSPDRGFRRALEALLDRLDGNGSLVDAILHSTTVAGTAFDRAAIVEQYDSTVLILPGQRAEIDALGNIVIRTRAREAA